MQGFYWYVVLALASCCVIKVLLRAALSWARAWADGTGVVDGCGLECSLRTVWLWLIRALTLKVWVGERC